MEEIKDETLEQKVERLEKANKYLTEQKLKYENGDAKLYYSIQRKLSEMAISLNGQSLESVDFMAKSDATFERIFKLLEKAESIANASKALGVIAGITGDEDKDTKKPYNDRLAESRN